MARTLEEIRQRGLEALRKELGRAGMIRFLQQFESGSGEYAQERHAWVDGTSLAELLTSAGVKPTKSKGGRRGKP
jgi:hypothetical protein